MLFGSECHFVHYDMAKIENFLDIAKEIPNYFMQKITFY